MLDRNDIPYVHWQMKRAPDGTAVLGAISAELDDLGQEIRQCILTPKRSVPLNPEKGCDLDQFRDRPMNVRHMFVAAEVREALARDVPRIAVHELSVDVAFASVSISVTWSPVEMVMQEFVTTEVAYVF
jgi:phage baseplate assembly protein W